MNKVPQWLMGKRHRDTPWLRQLHKTGTKIQGPAWFAEQVQLLFFCFVLFC